MDTTPRTLKELPLADGADGVFHPGERSDAVAARRGRSGVPVSPKVWRELLEKAGKPGITPAPAGTDG